MSNAELRVYLDAELLIRLWPALWLPARVKALWLERFRS